jgi:hypothetical protein
MMRSLALALGTDNDLMLRCASAVLRSDPSPTALIDINGTEVRDKYQNIVNALDRTIDFLRDELQVRHYKFLPYSGLLIPLCAYFSRNQSQGVPIEDRAKLLRWFWRTSFTHRYSGNPSQRIKQDVIAAIELRETGKSLLDSIPAEIGSDFYLSNTFSNRTVATKAFILQLAAHSPRSFIGGRAMSLDEVLSEPNRREYHHCYPRAYLARLEDVPPFEYEVNCLANFAFLNRTENRKISDQAPSQYISLMLDQVDEILESQLIPRSLFDDNFDAFAVDRMKMLTADAEKLQGMRDETRKEVIEPGFGVGEL